MKNNPRKTPRALAGAGLLLALSMLSGCASLHYRNTDTGELSGKLTVQWLTPDQFLFLPDPQDPLSFTRADATRIVPGAIYTDGGSVPRALWAVKNYSPWGYAPAFIIHDWLFEMQHCNLEGRRDYDVQEAAQVLSEVIKTLMERQEQIPANPFVLYSMHEAVRSPIAARLWDHGSCDILPAAARGESIAPVMEYTISFP